MNSNPLFKAVLLLLVGAAASATLILVTRENDHSEVRIAADQVRMIAERLDRLEDSLRSKPAVIRQDSAPAPATPVDVRRSEERGDNLLVLQEIRDGVKALVDAQGKFAPTGNEGIPKRADLLKRAVEADSFTPAKLNRRHFCWTPSQVYTTYGMPDGWGSAGDVSQWEYQVDGTDQTLRFQFRNGMISTVTLGR